MEISSFINDAENCLNGKIQQDFFKYKTSNIKKKALEIKKEPSKSLKYTQGLLLLLECINNIETILNKNELDNESFLKNIERLKKAQNLMEEKKNIAGSEKKQEQQKFSPKIEKNFRKTKKIFLPEEMEFTEEDKIQNDTKIKFQEDLKERKSSCENKLSKLENYLENLSSPERENLKTIKIAREEDKENTINNTRNRLSKIREELKTIRISTSDRLDKVKLHLDSISSKQEESDKDKLETKVSSSGENKLIQRSRGHEEINKYKTITLLQDIKVNEEEDNITPSYRNKIKEEPDTIQNEIPYTIKPSNKIIQNEPEKLQTRFNIKKFIPDVKFSPKKISIIPDDISKPIKELSAEQMEPKKFISKEPQIIKPKETKNVIKPKEIYSPYHKNPQIKMKTVKTNTYNTPIDSPLYNLLTGYEEIISSNRNFKELTKKIKEGEDELINLKNKFNIISKEKDPLNKELNDLINMTLSNIEDINILIEDINKKEDNPAEHEEIKSIFRELEELNLKIYEFSTNLTSSDEIEAEEKISIEEEMAKLDEKNYETSNYIKLKTMAFNLLEKRIPESFFINIIKQFKKLTEEALEKYNTIKISEEEITLEVLQGNKLIYEGLNEWIEGISFLEEYISSHNKEDIYEGLKLIYEGNKKLVFIQYFNKKIEKQSQAQTFQKKLSPAKIK